MNNRILLALVILLPQIVFGQDRVNKSLPVISDMIWNLKSATGWLNSADGQWLEGKNKIQHLGMNSTEYSKHSTGIYKIGFDNFDSLEVREVTVEGRSLLLLIKHFRTHKYEEVTSMQDYSIPIVAYLTVDKNTAKFDAERNSYELPLFYRGTVTPSPTYLNDIAAGINELAMKYTWMSKSKGSQNTLYFYYKQSDSDPSVGRFVAYTDIDGLSNHFFLPIPQPFDLKNKPLREYYYEVPAEKIEPLIDLLKPSGKK